MNTISNELLLDLNINNVFNDDEFDESDLVTPNASTSHNVFNFGFEGNAIQPNPYHYITPSVFFLDEFSMNSTTNNTSANAIPFQHSAPVDLQAWLNFECNTKLIESSNNNNSCIVDKSKKHSRMQNLMEIDCDENDNEEPEASSSCSPKKKAKRGRREEKIICSNGESEFTRSIIKGSWSEEEDGLLVELVTSEMKTHSQIRWTAVSKKIKTRTPKQCRERWTLNLNPNINHDPFTPEDDAILMDAYNKLGPRWTKIKDLLPGRTENSVKTRYKSIIRKLNKKNRSKDRLRRQGSQSSESVASSNLLSPSSSYSSVDEYVC